MRSLILCLFLPLAFGQGAQERVFHFQSSDTTEDMQEIGTLIRGIGDIAELSVDTSQQTLTVRGAADRIALSEWVFQSLDGGQPRDSGKEYRLSLSGDEVAAIFYVNTPTVQQFQEIATAVRSTADIRRLFTYNAPRAIMARGTASQIALAGWMFRQMDKPAVGQGASPSQVSEPNEFRNPDGGDDVVRVFYLTNTSTTAEFQELVMLIRSITGARRAFTYNAPRAFAVRGTAEQIALAAWLADELDTPARQGQGLSAHEYKVEKGRDDLVRVFYLDPSYTVAAFQKQANDLRKTTNTRLAFTYDGPRALVMRGTANELTWADQLLNAK